jgi:hypothetical protein
MEDHRIMGWLMTQLWQAPFLLLFGFGLVYSLSGRWSGSFVTLTAIGCALVLLAIVLSGFQQYRMLAVLADADHLRAATYSFQFMVANMLLRLGGFGLLLAAIFAGRGNAAPQTIPMG